MYEFIEKKIEGRDYGEWDKEGNMLSLYITKQFLNIILGRNFRVKLPKGKFGKTDL